MRLPAVMKKLPWGIFAGALAMMISFVTVAIVGFYVADCMLSELNETAHTIFDTWYQTLLFVVDLLCGLGFIGCIFMYFYLKRNGKKTAKDGEKV